MSALALVPVDFGSPGTCRKFVTDVLEPNLFRRTIRTTKCVGRSNGRTLEMLSTTALASTSASKCGRQLVGSPNSGTTILFDVQTIASYL